MKRVVLLMLLAAPALVAQTPADTGGAADAPLRQRRMARRHRGGEHGWKRPCGGAARGDGPGVG